MAEAPAKSDEQDWMDKAFERWPWPTAAACLGFCVGFGVFIIGPKLHLVERHEAAESGVVAGLVTAGAVLVLWFVVKFWKVVKWVIGIGAVIGLLIYDWKVVAGGAFAYVVLSAVLEWAMRVEQRQRQILEELRDIRTQIDLRHGR